MFAGLNMGRVTCMGRNVGSLKELRVPGPTTSKEIQTSVLQP